MNFFLNFSALVPIAVLKNAVNHAAHAVPINAVPVHANKTDQR